MMVGLMNPGSTTGFSFGQTVAQGQSANSGFGQSSGSGFSFGTPSQPTATATVNPLAPSSGISFGSAAQGSQATSGAFNLGQANPSASAGGFNFGQTNPSTSTGGFNLGQTNPSTSTGGFNLGQTNASTAGFNLGQTNPSASGGFNLGQTNQPASTAGFNLGQINPSAGAFNLGQANPPAASGGFSFGQTNPLPASSGGFSFAQPSTSTPSAGGINFGQVNPTTSSSAGLFGSAPSTGLNAQPNSSISSNLATGLFSQTPTSNPVASVAPSAGTNLFGTPTQTVNPTSSGGLFGPSTSGSAVGSSTQSSGLFAQTSTPSTQQSSGLNFGLSTNSTGGLFGSTLNASTSTGLNFGASAAPSTGFNTASSASGFSLTPSSTGLGGGSIFSSTTTTSAPSIGLGGSLPISSTLSTSGGLGGFQTSSIDSGIGNSISKGDGKSAKEAPLPQDIFSTIALFEGYKDTEKKCSEDNIRQTAAPFHKLVEDTKKLRQHILKLSNQHNQLHSSARKLKSAVIQEAENVEMTRRTQDTPMNLQGDNKAPEQFFLSLVRSFEERMTFCRNRIEEVEKCARNSSSVTEITSEDMKEVLKKEHEMVKMLAAKLYTLHNQLIQYTNQSSNPETQLEALFKPLPTESEPLGISIKNSNIHRPVLGEGGSGLLNFQNGQQRAKAVTLGAAPPTLPLQASIPSLLNSSNQNSLFSTPSNSTFGSSFLNFNNNNNNNNNSTTNFGFGNKSNFANNSTNNTSLFGNQTMTPNPSAGLFGSPNNSSLFGAAKNFKK